MISRRSVLSAVGAITSIMSGCAKLGTSSSAPRLAELSVQNKHDEPHTFHVQARADGTVREEWTYEAAAATYRDGELRAPTGRVWDDPLDGVAGVTLRARIDDEPWESLSFSDYSGECLRVEAEVETDGFFQLESAYPEDC